MRVTVEPIDDAVAKLAADGGHPVNGAIRTQSRRGVWLRPQRTREGFGGWGFEGIERRELYVIGVRTYQVRSAGPVGLIVGLADGESLCTGASGCEQADNRAGRDDLEVRPWRSRTDTIGPNALTRYRPFLIWERKWARPRMAQSNLHSVVFLHIRTVQVKSRLLNFRTDRSSCRKRANLCRLPAESD